MLLSSFTCLICIMSRLVLQLKKQEYFQFSNRLFRNIKIELLHLVFNIQRDGSLSFLSIITLLIIQIYELLSLAIAIKSTLECLFVSLRVFCACLRSGIYLALVCPCIRRFIVYNLQPVQPLSIDYHVMYFMKQIQKLYR